MSFVITLLSVLNGFAQSGTAITTFALNIDPVKISTMNADSTKPYALVAGGSRGIGYAIAEALASRGYNLILIARGMDGLVTAKTTLEAAYPVHVEIIQKDLSLESSAGEIAAWCNERSIPLKMLCNVAGLGGSSDYLSLPLDSLRYMVNLNVESCMAMSLLLLPLLEKNSPSYILNVASMAAFAPIPLKNMYSATKSAVLFFSYSLYHQLKGKNIHVSCLAPGPVFTKPEIEAETKKQLGWIGMKMAVPPKKVGEIAVRKTLRGRKVIVPGTLAGIMARFLRLFPRGFSASIYNRVGKK